MFKYNEIYFFIYVIWGVFQVEFVVMLSNVYVVISFGLFFELLGELEVYRGSIYYVSMFKVLGEFVLYL